MVDNMVDMGCFWVTQVDNEALFGSIIDRFRVPVG